MSMPMMIKRVILKSAKAGRMRMKVRNAKVRAEWMSVMAVGCGTLLTMLLMTTTTMLMMMRKRVTRKAREKKWKHF